MEDPLYTSYAWEETEKTKILKINFIFLQWRYIFPAAGVLP